MRKIGSALLMVLVLVLAACGMGGGSWAGDPQKIHEVRAGMTQAEVRRILGEPSKTGDMELLGIAMTVWEYHGPDDRLNVVFDAGQTVAATGLNGAEIVNVAGQ